jgi:putative PIN family toxin of toxin-antitoxin system
MRVVLDTNVIISALLFNGVPERVVLLLLGGDGIIVSSPFISEETSRILRGKFKVELAHLALLQQLLEQSEMQYFQPYIHVLDDEPDNRILETAKTGNAGFIITGDRGLLAQASYQGIRILRPADFLEFDRRQP